MKFKIGDIVYSEKDRTMTPHKVIASSDTPADIGIEKGFDYTLLNPVTDKYVSAIEDDLWLL
jgi:hypothetical protein